ncbi:unnamed protein product [Symbiodinium microadriaticum]|nr:unnamed protein product [Symbiodinium microadriaticum]
MPDSPRRQETADQRAQSEGAAAKGEHVSRAAAWLDNQDQVQDHAPTAVPTDWTEWTSEPEPAAENHASDSWGDFLREPHPWTAKPAGHKGGKGRGKGKAHRDTPEVYYTRKLLSESPGGLTGTVMRWMATTVVWFRSTARTTALDMSAPKMSVGCHMKCRAKSTKTGVAGSTFARRTLPTSTCPRAVIG